VRRFIARQLGVSGDTVRRDLDELANAGRVRRVRGGALPAVSTTPPRVADGRELHAAG
jgi:DeoR/GlpR family transcriptional regulator of sugar metabolism